MSYKIIGKCSLCGGNVREEKDFTYSPKASCSTCGAIRKPNVPVIEMESPLKETRELLLD